MRLGNRRPGTSIAFVDAPTEEILLQVASDGDGRPAVYYRLYDSTGCLTAESAGLECYPTGLTIHSDDGELLLCLPEDPGLPIVYRLYNREGHLITWSDGASTRIQPLLRMVAGRC